ncbi:MAG TPA: GNAT family N-acetyltransferase [Bacteroidales bacterium]
MLKIVRDNSNSEDFRQLVELLDKELYLRYGALQAQYDKYNKIEFLDTVVIGYIDKKPAGCGCFKVFETNTVEIKRMIVKSEHRGSGIASMILLELEKWAVEMGFSGAVLETGIKQVEAIKFYTKLGYQRIGNYGQYIGNENSICMSKELTTS